MTQSLRTFHSTRSNTVRFFSISSFPFLEQPPMLWKKRFKEEKEVSVIRVLRKGESAWEWEMWGRRNSWQEEQKTSWCETERRAGVRSRRQVDSHSLEAAGDEVDELGVWTLEDGGEVPWPWAALLSLAVGDAAWVALGVCWRGKVSLRTWGRSKMEEKKEVSVRMWGRSKVE